MWRVAANILNKQSQTADKGWYFSLGGDGFGEVLSTPYRKNISLLRNIHRPILAWTDTVVQPKQ
jgi:hypothetical protein